MSSFASILDRPSTEIERPKPLPQGTYLTVINGMPRYDKSSKKQTEFSEFSHKFLQAMEDVDQDDLNTWMQKPDGSTRSLGDHNMKSTYYHTEDAAWRLKKFLEDLGTTDEDGTLRQRSEMAPGRQVKVFVTHESSQDGSTIFAKIGNTAPADE